MCGIAGVVRWGSRPVTEPEVARMTSALAHRGPDGHGLLVRDTVALGHRRLSIIDLATGAQPMTNENQTVWITFNGEIYNFKQLRRQLEAHGHAFATRSDTEVIIHAYEQWGVECVTRLRGMFAFAIADLARRRVLLARDPFGIKPLVYRQGKGYFAFASELDALRQVEDDRPTGSLAAVEQFLRFGYIPTPMTIYRDAWKLSPAHWMTVGFDGQISPPHCYWQQPFQPGHDSDDVDVEAWVDRFEATLQESVQAHLVSDVPFGVFLSGGIDSTLVTLHMCRLLERPVTAFSIGFEDQAYSEVKHAQHVAQKLGIELIHEQVRPDPSLLPEVVRQYGEPFADSSALPTWHVCRLARRHVPMVLSGDGGDELFAGYGRYHLFQHRSAASLVSEVLRRRGDWPLALRLLGGGGVRGFARPLDAWLALVNYLPRRARSALWRAEHRKLVGAPTERFEQAAAQGKGMDDVPLAQWIDVRTYLPDDILTKVDIAAMAHGLEVRPPLLDLKVAALAAEVPMLLRLGVGRRGRLETKRLPKLALQRHFASDFIHRRKQGFAIPRDRWLLPGQPMRQLLDELLDDSDSLLHEWFEPRTTRRLRQLHDWTRRCSTGLWPLLVLGLWVRGNRGVVFA